MWYKQNIRKRTAWGSWKSPSNPHILPSWEYVMIFHKRDWKLRGDRKKADITAKEFLKCSDGFWEIKPVTRRKDHPAPFPEELVYRLIKFYTYRDNVVLDPFGGTGTVALVALKTGRHFIHIDISKKYCRRTHARLKRYLSSKHARKLPVLSTSSLPR
jgi:DNA modification methylase